ncbi:isochorismatase family cysteine hydrolase [Streptomyces tremellae]|uniref:Cysteine hydrolase n=1 Tax=Streptomyces tremellae TaxID=1124239 RepID=A0ABP7FVK5_9ACTN
MTNRPDPSRSALLTIDVQNDFTLPGSPHAIPGTHELVPAMAEIAAAFRARRLPVVHVVRLYLPDGSNAELSRRDALAGGARIVLPGSPGSGLRPELAPCPVELDHAALLRGAFQPVGEAEWLMYKPRWGAFFGTGLTGHLRGLGVDTVVVIGANFPNCPRTTLYEASERDFHAVVVPDAVSRAYPRGMDECAEMGALVLGARELIGWLPPSP